MQKSNYNDYVSTERPLCVAVVVFNNIVPILFDVDIKARSITGMVRNLSKNFIENVY